MKISCVYLARSAEGENAFKSFVESYKLYPAGIQHRLIVVFKGFDAVGLGSAQEIFKDIDYETILMDDVGYDIGAYFFATQKFDSEYFCYLNTFSRVECEGWLEKLSRHINDATVGIVGATGSYESLNETYRFLDAIRWYYAEKRLPMNEDVDYYLHWFLKTFCAREQRRSVKLKLKLKMQILNLAERLKIYQSIRAFEKSIFRHYRLGGKRAYPASLPRFPNPHVRSNGFMMRRADFLATNIGLPQSKEQCLDFESGENGISASMVKRGKRILLVGRDGHGHDVEDWAKCGSYRSREQKNLLISDNQTRRYDTLSDGEKITYQFLTWGNKMEDTLSENFPRMGLEFDAKSYFTKQYHGFNNI
eukprot:gene17467-17659_t